MGFCLAPAFFSLLLLFVSPGQGQNLEGEKLEKKVKRKSENKGLKFEWRKLQKEKKLTLFTAKST